MCVCVYVYNCSYCFCDEAQSPFYLVLLPSFSPSLNDWQRWSVGKYAWQFSEGGKRKERWTGKKSKHPPPPPDLTRPRRLCPWRDGAVWRWDCWDAGWMDGLLRGRWGITLKISLHPRRKSAGQAADGFSRGWETWRLELLLIWRRWSQSCDSAVMSEPGMSVSLYPVLRNKCLTISHISYFTFCFSHLFHPFKIAGRLDTFSILPYCLKVHYIFCISMFHLYDAYIIYLWYKFP